MANLGRLLKKVGKKAQKRGTVPSITIVTEDSASAQVRTNLGSKTTDYTTTMTVSPKPVAVSRYLSSLP